MEVRKKKKKKKKNETYYTQTSMIFRSCVQSTIHRQMTTNTRSNVLSRHPRH